MGCGSSQEQSPAIGNATQPSIQRPNSTEPNGNPGSGQTTGTHHISQDTTVQNDRDHKIEEDRGPVVSPAAVKTSISPRVRKLIFMEPVPSIIYTQTVMGERTL